MSVKNYLEKNFYPWAKIILISNENQKVLFEGNVGDCHSYLDKKVIPKPLNFSKDVTKILVCLWKICSKYKTPYLHNNVD